MKLSQNVTCTDTLSTLNNQEFIRRNKTPHVGFLDGELEGKVVADGSTDNDGTFDGTPVMDGIPD